MLQIRIIFLFFLFFSNLYSVNFITRDINNTTLNPSGTDFPTNLGYFKYYKALPKQIDLPILTNKNMSSYHDKKHLFVGYGVDSLMDVNASQCKIIKFHGKETRACFPWWEIDRVYQCSNSKPITNDVLDRVAKETHPPKMVHICQKWSAPVIKKGGLVTCTAYYDKNKGPDCETNPTQAKCLVNNCSAHIRNDCTFQKFLYGAKINIQYPKLKDIPPNRMAYQNINGSSLSYVDRFMKLGTLVYKCPDTTDISQKKCLKQKNILMFPAMCKPDNPKTPQYDAIWKYCNTSNYKIVDGKYIFTDTCSPSETADGIAKQIQCTTDVCTNELQCIKPVYADLNNTKIVTCKNLKRLKEPCKDVYDLYHSNNKLYKLVYTPEGNPVFSQDGKCYIAVETGYLYDNPFEKDPNCIRVSNPDEETSKAQVHMQAGGMLDDDIFVIKNTGMDTFQKIYCNQQHDEKGASIRYSYNFSGYKTTGYKEVHYMKYDTSGDLISAKTINIDVVKNSSSETETKINLVATSEVTVEENKPLLFYIDTVRGVQSVKINPIYNKNRNNLIEMTQTQIKSGGGIVYKSYMGTTLKCIDNNGHFKFDGSYEVSPGDVISMQRATENDNGGCRPFTCGRTNFASSAVQIGGYTVADQAYPKDGDYEYYPHTIKGCYGAGCYNIWEDTLFSVSLLFPYAGRYKLEFVSLSGDTVAVVYLSDKDFQKIAQTTNGRLQLRLGSTVVNKDQNGYYNTKLLDSSLFGNINPNTYGFNSNTYENNSTILGACLDDMAEVGCGVHGNHALKDSISNKNLLLSTPINNKQFCTGSNCINVPEPRKDFVQEHAIDHIIITNYTDNKVINIKLVYPLAQMNQIYISKLDLYRKLAYECYKDKYEQCINQSN